MGYPLGPGMGGGQSPIPIDWTEGAKPRAVSVKAVTASQPLFTGLGFLLGGTFAETTGSAKALAYIHDGTDASGLIVAVLGALSGGGGSFGGPWPATYFQAGLYLEVVTGTITVSVSFVPLVDQLPN